MARFTEGQEVVANTTAQGMTAGEHYMVQGVEVFSTAFGDFVTYVLENYNGDVLSVGNGHLLLSEVA